VPPPATGGPLGAVFATVGLAFEVLGTLLSGIVGSARGVFEGSGFAFLARLFVFLMLFALLGSVLAGVLLAVVRSSSLW
jgi:hypothetical protein